jgi:hypothetical protein
MSERTQYFRKFPITIYKGQPAINLLRRVDFNSNIKNFVSNFYTHTMTTDDKIENISFNYYGDVDYDWVLYHANDIIDPRYDVPSSYDTFEDFIIKKYGSKRKALREVIYYKNNYEGDDQIISLSAYSALEANIKKYYQPVLGALGVAGYERAEIDFIASTNQIISMSTVSVTGTFEKDEVVYRNSDTTNIAQIAFSSSDEIILQHIRGNFFSQTNFTLTGETSGAVATINADTVKLLTNVIEVSEQVFYKPITIYEDEETKNENKREIYLVDNSYVSKLNKQLTDILK